MGICFQIFVTFSEFINFRCWLKLGFSFASIPHDLMAISSTQYVYQSAAAAACCLIAPLYQCNLAFHHLVSIRSMDCSALLCDAAT
jgi:hypothetical protein